MNIKVPVKSIVINAASLNLPHTAWTEVLSNLLYSASHFEVYNGSTTPILIATGSSGNEAALPYAIMGGGTNGPVAQNIGAGSRITLQPVSSDIVNGFIVINLFSETT